MVTGEPRYVSHSDGAPPLPPPGGYRGARRLGAPAGGPDTPPPPGTPVPSPSPARRTGPLGWTAVGLASGFALVLLILFAVGALDAFYSTMMLVLQLIVVAVVVAALVVRRGRLLGAIALTVTLIFNLASVGALGAVGADAGGGYENSKTVEQKYWEAYPGIKDVSPETFLSQPSLEEVRALSEETLTAVRERLTAEFGFTWVPVGDENLRRERNGYGGESMLVQYRSPSWATVEPVHDYATKLAVMRTIESELMAQGYSSMFAFNEPGNGVDSTLIRKLYGADDPRDQVNWESYADTYPSPALFYADITDLSNDTTGAFRASREASSARTGEPLEGLSLTAIAHQVLSAKDVDAFEQALNGYP